METTSLSKLVADLEQNTEKSTKELSELKATLLVNFGPTAKHFTPVIDGNEPSATAMFVKIMDPILEMLKEAEGYFDNYAWGKGPDTPAKDWLKKYNQFKKIPEEHLVFPKCEFCENTSITYSDIEGKSVPVCRDCIPF